MTPTAFGLEIGVDRTVPFLGDGDGVATGRELRLDQDPETDPTLAGGELIADERRRGGEIEFQIEFDPDRGYLIGGPEYGSCLLDPTGRRASGWSGAGGPTAWQRLLVAQTLPFAAVLQGLEAFHAAAVSLDDRAVAFTGPSGCGKTSLALALHREGAGLLADDVIAVEALGDEDVLVHPGAPVTGVAREEVERLDETGGARLGEELGANRREILFRVVLDPRPLPLGVLFLLDRRPDGPGRPRFRPAPDPRALLSTTFNLLISSPERLLRQLEICARIARGTVERIEIGPAVDPSALAAAVRDRLAGPG